MDELVRRLREEAAGPEQSRTPLTVEQTTSAASILDGEVARIVTDAFEAHRSLLMTKYAWITSPIESGATGSAWRVGGVVRGPVAELGDVLLVYGAPELVRQAVTAFLASTVPKRRLADRQRRSRGGRVRVGATARRRPRRSGDRSSTRVSRRGR